MGDDIGDRIAANGQGNLLTAADGLYHLTWAAVQLTDSDWRVRHDSTEPIIDCPLATVPPVGVGGYLPPALDHAVPGAWRRPPRPQQRHGPAPPRAVGSSSRGPFLQFTVSTKLKGAATSAYRRSFALAPVQHPARGELAVPPSSGLSLSCHRYRLNLPC